MILRLHRVLTLVQRTLWLHVWGYGGVGRRDILVMGMGFLLSALLWAILSRNIWVPLLVVGAGALLCPADWAILELLPRLGISYGRVSSGLWFILAGRGIALVVANELALLGLGLVWLFRARGAWHWGARIVGALFIGLLWDTEYEMGRYHVEGTVLLLSRGVGFSGGYEPQARFGCPPEVALITLGGA